MPSRYIHLVYTLAGYQKTGMPLIEFYNNDFFPSNAADDLGIYIVIPKIAYFFNLSLTTAIAIFFYGILTLPTLISISGFFKLYSSLLQRAIASIGVMALMLFTWSIGEVYLAYYACAIIIIPWGLYFIKQEKISFYFLFYLFLSGFTISFFHYIRAYSGIGPLLFIITLVGLNAQFSLKQKSVFFLSLLIGLSLPISYFTYAYNQHKKYATEHFPNQPIGQKNHVLWHNTYIGFSFLNFKNPDPEYLQWGDNYAAEKVQSINPEIINNSPEYEEILKQEILKLIKKYPIFVLATIFAKIGILFLYLLIFCNFGLLAAFFYPKPWQEELAFWLALGFSSLFPLLVIPVSEYSLGFISFATLYGIVSINYALRTGIFKSHNRNT